MNMKSIILLSFLAISCSPEPTQEQARSMFREPSSEKKGQIPEKFQPIDHKIDTHGQ